ncbi:MAG: DoxX family membrane protein [Deltaproteobacteria bacterium]|nr:DoxX family membrane protein [Deltaproteobacteria bacterium]
MKSRFLRLFEIILGALFIYAGCLKLLHPYDFASAVLAYRLLPVALAGPAAAVIPWLEAAAGLLLVLGLKRRSCLLILGSLGAVFLVVMSITAIRGLKIDCGCGLFFQRQVGPASILEDAFLLLWTAGLYYWEVQLVKDSAANYILAED